MRSSISYESLIIAPFKLISILNLNIEKKINEHGKLYLKGVIPEEDKDTYINSIDTQVDLKDGESGKTIFRGRIIEIKVNLVRGVHYIEVEALSNTYEFDLRIKKRSFQNMNLNSIVKSIVSEYNGNFISTVNESELFKQNKEADSESEESDNGYPKLEMAAKKLKLPELEKVRDVSSIEWGKKNSKIKLAASRVETLNIPSKGSAKMIAFDEGLEVNTIETDEPIDKGTGVMVAKLSDKERAAIQDKLAKKNLGTSNNILGMVDDKTKHTIILQYNETDWEFLIRIASRLGVGLVSDCTSEASRFWIGVPKGKNLGSIEKFTYSVCKEVDRFKYISRNSTKDHLEKDFINYEIETGEVFSIGDVVTFEDQNLSIIAVESIFKDGVLKSFYKLSSRGGAAQRTIYNKDIIGLSLEGKVTAVSGDKLKVHLKIDKSAGSYQFAYSSPYTAEGSGGWYAMPEVGDTVYVYFPDDREENAFSTLSLRKDGGGLGDPSTKYFKTKSGKELIFSAEGKLQLSCQASLIKMAGDIVISGNDVKLN